MFTLEVINSDTSDALESVAFETYRDLSQYVWDAIEWGIQVSNVRYKVGNIILDFHTVYMVVGKRDLPITRLQGDVSTSNRLTYSIKSDV